jgi:hypothetical protein
MTFLTAPLSRKMHLSASSFKHRVFVSYITRPPWRFLIFNIGGDDAALLELCPDFLVAARMGQVISVWLSRAGCAVDKELAMQHVCQRKPGGL